MRKKKKIWSRWGLKVLRFHDGEVLRDIDNVNRAIEQWVEIRQTELGIPPPAPACGGDVRSKKEIGLIKDKKSHPLFN